MLAGWQLASQDKKTNTVKHCEMDFFRFDLPLRAQSKDCLRTFHNGSEKEERGENKTEVKSDHWKHQCVQM